MISPQCFLSQRAFLSLAHLKPNALPSSVILVLSIQLSSLVSETSFNSRDVLCSFLTRCYRQIAVTAHIAIINLNPCSSRL